MSRVSVSACTPVARLAGAAALAAALAGCAAFPQPFAQVSGERYFRATIDTYPVQIVSIDGRDTLDRLVYIDPGLRRITVQGPADIAHRWGEQRDIALNVAPCTRYYLVAVKPNRLSKDFDIKVDYQESLAGCHEKPTT